MALSRSDADAIRRVVHRLRAEHAEREAAAIERLVQQALAPPDRTGALSGYMTTGEAAGLIGVSLQTIKNWARRGRLVGARVGGRTLVTRASAQAFFDGLPSAPEQADSGDLSRAEAADRELMESLPDGLVQRVEALLDRARAGHKLSPAEQKELRRLARAGSTAATRRARDRISRRQRV